MTDLDKLIAAAVAVAEAMPPEERAAMMEAQRQSWARGEASLAEPSASPPRVPGASAQFTTVGVESGPGQPMTDAREAVRQAVAAVEAMGADTRLTDAVNFLNHAWYRLNHFRAGVYPEPLNTVIAVAELERLRKVAVDAHAEGFRAGIEAALLVPSVWPADVADLLARTFAEKSSKHGQYESLFAVVAAFLRHRRNELAADSNYPDARYHDGIVAAANCVEDMARGRTHPETLMRAAAAIRALGDARKSEGG